MDQAAIMHQTAYAQILALDVLNAACPKAKTQAAIRLKTLWDHPETRGPDVTANLAAKLSGSGPIPPDSPARPDLPIQVDPRDVKRRRLGSRHGRVALLHAIAHIEFNAIDLAADMVARFGDTPRIADNQRRGFIDDWIQVCADEARHFNMIEARLKTLGSTYGALDAHNGLWEAALKTKHDLAARLAIAPMVLEARGLDVTPGMIVKLTNVGDFESADVLQIILNEEIAHVQAGTHWFNHICARENRKPVPFFQSLVDIYYKGQLKPPFNIEARTRAGLKKEYYQANTVEV